MQIRPRTEWQTSSQPITGPAPTGAERDWIIHYPGSDSTQPQTDAEMPQYLRNLQNYFVTSKGYSSCYNFAVCNATGSVWEIRGFDYRNAANSGGKVNGNANDWTTSINVTCSNSDAVTDVAVNAVNALIAMKPAYGVIKHVDVEWTSCPGSALTTAVDSGRIGQGAGTTPPPSGDCVNAAPGDGAWSLMRKLGMTPEDAKQRDDFFSHNWLVHPNQTVCRPPGY